MPKQIIPIKNKDILEIDGVRSFHNGICACIRVDDTYISIRQTAKEVRAYAGNRIIAKNLDRIDDPQKLVDILRQGIEESRSKQVDSFTKKHGIIGVILSEVRKKYPEAYIKTGRTPKIAVAFLHCVAYVFLDDTKLMVNFNAPDTDGDYFMCDITDPKNDPVKKTLALFDSCQKTESMVVEKDDA